ncbi:MAG: YgaP-like transmembrane domain [Haloquadratum sp.]
MEQNVGQPDSIARIAIGAIAGLVSLGILAGMIDLSGVISLILGIIAIILLATGLYGTCPIYSALGMSTRGAR